MRNMIVFLRLLITLFLAVAILGCGAGNKQADRITDEEARAQGLVQDPATGAWSYPQQNPYDQESSGYASEDDASEDDAAEDQGQGDTSDDTDEASADRDEADDDADEQADAYPAETEDADAGKDEDDGDQTGVSAGSEPAGYASNSGYGDPYGQQQQGDPKYYAEKIVPILQAHCYNCHGGGPQGEKGGVALYSPETIDEAYVVSARDVQGSLLYEVITSTDPKTRMPPRGERLSQEEVDIIAKWINDGASYGDAPRDAAPAGRGSGGYGEDDPYGAYGGQANAGGYGGYGDGDGDGEGTARPAPVRPQNLAEWASLSFQNGRDTEAMNQLYAQALVRSKNGESVLEKYQWYPGFKRAKLAVRWGVGIKYLGKNRYEGRPRPVGVVQDLPGEEFDDVDERERDEGARKLHNETLHYYAGDIGDELMVRLKMRIERGYYGDILKAELEESLSSSGDEDEDFYEEDTGYGRSGGSSGYGGYGGGDGGSNEDEDKPDGDKIEQLMPGVTLLGVAGATDLFQRARDHDIDLLVVFDVVSDPNRVRRFVDTSTRVRLYDVATEKQLAITGKINNVEIQKLRSDDPDDRTVIDEMTTIFDIVDKTYPAKAFPDVTNPKGQAAVIGFVKSVLADPSPNPLWKLGEIRFYEHRGGLKPEHALAAMKKVVPSAASKLQTVGTDDDVRKLLERWLTIKESLASGGGDGELGEAGGEEDAFR